MSAFPQFSTFASAHESAAEQFSPGRLWSLLDMLKINGRAFYSASTYLSYLKTTNEAIREGRSKKRSGLDKIIHDYSNDDPRRVAECLNKLRGELVTLECKLSLITLDECLNKLEEKKLTYNQLHEYIKILDGRIIDEITLVSLFCISEDKAKFYASPEPVFGSEVAAKFPSVSYEIDEAAKCIALDRSTASAFHSIRCLEAGIRAIARCLGIADPTRGTDRSWAKILGAVKTEIDRRWPPSFIRTGGDDRLFDESHAALAAMQNPWRNSTMHLDQVYTPEDARHLFEIVGGFMRKIASRMDEQGLPKA